MALVAEGVLRFAGFTHEPVTLPPILLKGDEDQPDRGEGVFVSDTAQLWSPRPGVKVVYGAEQGERINADGYRGPLRSPRPAAGVLRVVALGDSSTFGMGVPYHDTWCAQLEGLLDSEGEAVEVIDAGVIGFTIDQGLERYDELVHALAPDVVIAAFGGINECHPAAIRPDRAKIELRKEPRPVRRAFTLLREHSRVVQLAGWAVDRARGVSRESVLERWRLEREERGDVNQRAGRLDWDGERRVGLERFSAALDELAARARRDGAGFVLVSMPRAPHCDLESPMLARYSQAVTDAAERTNAALLDARAAFLSALAGPPARDWSELFLDIYHPSRAGHALIARELAPLVRPWAASKRASSPASTR